MGREAICTCLYHRKRRAMRVLLESGSLILRGDDVLVTVRFEDIAELTLSKDWLQFSFKGQQVGLQLGALEGGKWLKKITTPPPSLADKLGFKTGVNVGVIGAIDEPALLDALKGQRTVAQQEADVLITVATSTTELQLVLAKISGRPCAPIWVVYAKGPKSTLGETGVRELMRGSGFIDTKVSAVSATLTATRYQPRSH